MTCEKCLMKNVWGPLTNIWQWSEIHVRELFVYPLNFVFILSLKCVCFPQSLFPFYLTDCKRLQTPQKAQLLCLLIHKTNKDIN